MIKQEHLLYAYNITIGIYNNIFAKQGGRCAICNIHQTELSYPLEVDHDHIIKKVRGLLCRNCNGKLGRYKDDINNIIEHINECRTKLNNAYSTIKYLKNEPYYLTDDEAKLIYKDKMKFRKRKDKSNKDNIIPIN